MSQLPQGVEEFIAEHAREVSYGRDSVMRDIRGNAVSVYDLRAWMSGHVRVPVEPTAEMKQAAIKVDIGDDGDIVLTWEEVERLYRAMLNAAPAPEGDAR